MKRIKQVLETLLIKYQDISDKRFVKALEIATNGEESKSEDEIHGINYRKRRKTTTRHLCITRTQMNNDAETFVDSEGVEFIVSDSRIFLH